MSLRSLVRPMGLEPIRSPIRPSNVRVCLFRHGRTNDLFLSRKLYYHIGDFFATVFLNFRKLSPTYFFFSRVKSFCAFFGALIFRYDGSLRALKRALSQPLSALSECICRSRMRLFALYTAFRGIPLSLFSANPFSRVCGTALCG